MLAHGNSSSVIFMGIDNPFRNMIYKATRKHNVEPSLIKYINVVVFRYSVRVDLIAFYVEASLPKEDRFLYSSKRWLSCGSYQKYVVVTKKRINKVDCRLIWNKHIASQKRLIIISLDCERVLRAQKSPRVNWRLESERSTNRSTIQNHAKSGKAGLQQKSATVWGCQVNAPLMRRRSGTIH